VTGGGGMKNNKQFEPFDDFKEPSFHVYDAQGEERPWREVAKQMREFPREQKSEMLSHITDVYRTELKDNGQDEALKKFWQEVDSMRKHGFLTDDMHKKLLEAKDRNIKAAQTMVRANPVVIHLPFIAQTMRGVVDRFKYSDSGVGVLNEVKKFWLKFLPDRTKRITYSDADLKQLISIAEKQEDMTFGEAKKLVAQELMISLDKKITKYKKKGRPKK